MAPSDAPVACEGNGALGLRGVGVCEVEELAIVQAAVPELPGLDLPALHHHANHRPAPAGEKGVATGIESAASTCPSDISIAREGHDGGHCDQDQVVAYKSRGRVGALSLPASAATHSFSRWP